MTSDLKELYLNRAFCTLACERKTYFQWSLLFLGGRKAMTGNTVGLLFTGYVCLAKKQMDVDHMQ